MNIRVETAGPCRREVHIEVPADRVGTAFSEVLAAYTRMAKIPGFRPGKAPRDLIRRRFQKEINGEVKERLIPEGYQAAVKQEKLQTIAVVDVRDQNLEEGQAFAFTVTLDVAPDFALPTYKGMALEGQKVAIQDADVDAVLENIREQNARFEDVAARPVQKGDLVQIDYEGVCEGQPVEQRAPRAKGMGVSKDFWMMADEQNEFLPGFAQGLLGATVGEQRQVTVNFPADFAESELAGRTATYAVTVKALREKKLPEIDAEFIKGVGVDSVEALKARVREDLVRMREQNEKRRLQNEAAKRLLEQTQVEVPDSVLQEETRNEVYDLVRSSQQRGVTKDDIEGKKEELFDTATRTATEKVKLRYILRKIASTEGIEVAEQDVEARIVSLARGWGVPPDRLRADLEKKNALGQVRDDVLLSKTLTWLVDHAEVKS
jgi:trigger factor